MCISPLLRDVNETRCTLDFGLRALKISSTAYVNVEVNYVVFMFFLHFVHSALCFSEIRPAGILRVYDKH